MNRSDNVVEGCCRALARFKMRGDMRRRSNNAPRSILAWPAPRPKQYAVMATSSAHGDCGVLSGTRAACDSRVCRHAAPEPKYWCGRHHCLGQRLHADDVRHGDADHDFVRQRVGRHGLRLGFQHVLQHDVPGAEHGQRHGDGDGELNHLWVLGDRHLLRDGRLDRRSDAEPRHWRHWHKRHGQRLHADDVRHGDADHDPDSAARRLPRPTSRLPARTTARRSWCRARPAAR